VRSFSTGFSAFASVIFVSSLLSLVTMFVEMFTQHNIQSDFGNSEYFSSFENISIVDAALAHVNFRNYIRERQRLSILTIGKMFANYAPKKFRNPSIISVDLVLKGVIDFGSVSSKTFIERIWIMSAILHGYCCIVCEQDIPLFCATLLFVSAAGAVR
jgi:hypothetical protein